MRHAVILSGPIGVGKTTLARALAARLDAAFIDGDDLRDHAKPWIGDVLTASRKLVRAAQAALARHPVVFLAQPLRERDWRFLRHNLAASGVTTHCVTLTAELDTILSPARGRTFDAGERARIAEMIAQGYGSRPFSNLVVETGREGFAATLGRLEAGCLKLLVSAAAPK